ncbi:unnamed protein product [Brassica oleracea var. botrytis]
MYRWCSLLYTTRDLHSRSSSQKFRDRSLIHLKDMGQRHDCKEIQTQLGHTILFPRRCSFGHRRT